MSNAQNGIATDKIRSDGTAVCSDLSAVVRDDEGGSELWVLTLGGDLKARLARRGHLVPLQALRLKYPSPGSKSWAESFYSFGTAVIPLR